MTEVIESDAATAERIPGELLSQMPAECLAAIERGERVWTTEEMTAEFTVDGFVAPMVVVHRKSDGARGFLWFTHRPRFYFGWEDA